MRSSSSLFLPARMAFVDTKPRGKSPRSICARLRTNSRPSQLRPEPYPARASRSALAYGCRSTLSACACCPRTADLPPPHPPSGHAASTGSSPNGVSGEHRIPALVRSSGLQHRLRLEAVAALDAPLQLADPHRHARASSARISSARCQALCGPIHVVLPLRPSASASGFTWCSMSFRRFGAGTGSYRCRRMDRNAVGGEPFEKACEPPARRAGPCRRATLLAVRPPLSIFGGPPTRRTGPLHHRLDRRRMVAGSISARRTGCAWPGSSPRSRQRAEDAQVDGAPVERAGARRGTSAAVSSGTPICLEQAAVEPGHCIHAEQATAHRLEQVRRLLRASAAHSRPPAGRSTARGNRPTSSAKKQNRHCVRKWLTAGPARRPRAVSVVPGEGARGLR